jgi:hypothetical protein
MKIKPASFGTVVAVLVLFIGCARANVASTTAQPAASATTAAEAVREPTAGLARFVGEYQFDQFKATIRLRGGTLVRQVQGSTEQVLTPISDTRFKMGNTPAELQFTLDKSGEVIGVVEGVEGHSRRGTRVRKT